MRTLIRYLLFFGLLVGGTYAAVNVRVDGRTLFAHTKAWVAAQTMRADPARPAPKPTAKETRKARKRVTVLKAAAAQIGSQPPPRKPKTRVDPHVSKRQKKALDELLSSRVTRE